MKLLNAVLGSAMLVVSAGLMPAAAQTAPVATANTPVEVREFAPTVLQQYNSIKTLITKTVDKMPGEAFSFQPTPEMRTFAGTVGHLVSSNIGQCGNLLGRKHALSGQDLSKTLKTKEETVKAVADSFAFCDEYFTALKTNDQLTADYYSVTVNRAGEPVTFKVAKGGSIAGLLAHNNEEYGYLAVHLRLKGIVPPSSEPPPVKK